MTDHDARVSRFHTANPSIIPVLGPSEAHLIKILRSAASGELAAGFAYRGHAKSVRSAEERTRLLEIEQEEWHHRALVQGLLASLGSAPSPSREIVFWMIGHCIALLCRVGGWFLPMYGAGRLERGNIEEYESAARDAQACGHLEMIDCLLTMAEVEWEHELYFRERIRGHWLTRVLRLWEAPSSRESIRARFENWVAQRGADRAGGAGSVTR